MSAPSTRRFVNTSENFKAVDDEDFELDLPPVCSSIIEEDFFQRPESPAPAEAYSPLTQTIPRGSSMGMMSLARTHQLYITPDLERRLVNPPKKGWNPKVPIKNVNASFDTGRMKGALTLDDVRGLWENTNSSMEHMRRTSATPSLYYSDGYTSSSGESEGILPGRDFPYGASKGDAQDLNARAALFCPFATSANYPPAVARN